MLTKIYGFLFLSAFVGVILFGALLGTGIAVGSMMTAGMFLILGSLPGFWAFAETKVGSIILAVLTALLVHTVLGGTTVTAIVAVGWAFVAKQICLTMARNHHLSEGVGG